MSKLEKFNNNPVSAAPFEAPGNERASARFVLTRGHILLMLFALLSLLFIAFITLARSIQVSAVTPVLTDPERLLKQPADIQLDAWFKLPIGNRILVLPGQHTVSLSADGFSSVEQTLIIGAERHQQYEIVLTRLPGKLSVSLNEALINNDLAASVYVDGNKLGELAAGMTKMTFDDIEAGERQITVDAPLYRSVTQTVLIKGKGQTESLALELPPAWAEYSLSTTPVAAAVLVDGQNLGNTPLSVKLEEGSRSLVVQAKGFKPFKQDINVVAQQDLMIPAIELIPADGKLELSSSPDNAAVIINGEYRGNTPLKLAVIPNQNQQIKLYKAGYRLDEQNLSLAPDETAQKQIQLQQDLVSVRISVTPSSATVYVDGVAQGQGSQTLNLTTLPHNISVRKAGYVTQNNDIIPNRQNKQIISVSLLTEEQHYWAQLPNRYTNGLGHSMVLFKSPGTVQMGSSRRENGRRANEVQYTAELTKSFYVSLHETNNKQFRAFKASHNAGNYKKKSLDANKAPAVNISWQQAAQYCNWLSKREGLDPFYQVKKGYISGLNPNANGYRLLTEAEWSWLARNKGQEVLLYPWGNSAQAPTSQPIENLADQQAADIIAFTVAGYDDGYRGPSPVGRFPANHRGLFDMGGNAAEWVNDWYSAKGSSKQATKGVIKDPLGPEIGEFHVIRGASWARGHLPQVRLAYRDYSAKGKHDVGFRIARYAGPSSAKKIAQTTKAKTKKQQGGS